MTDPSIKVREHYGAAGLTDRVKAALATIAPEGQALTVAQLAPFDQFHTRGILATAELAHAAGLDPSTRVLDVGCGIGGPARYLAATFGCKVTGIDLSPAFIDAATYLTARCGLSDRVTFHVGDALHLPFEDATFDPVFLQHVAMNLEDRDALYAEVRRILAPEGRFITYDLVLRDGDVLYPVPWTRDASASFLLSESDTRTALGQAGYKAVLWRDDTQAARLVQGCHGHPAAEQPKPRVGHGPGLCNHDRQSRSQPPGEPSGCAFRGLNAGLKQWLRSALAGN